MDIELLPHRGVSKVRGPRGKIVEKHVELDQWQISSKDPAVAIHDHKGEYLATRLGYVGKTPGSPIMFVRQYPDAIHEAVKAAVKEKTGRDSVTKQPPARWIEADEPESDESDDDDDDDTDIFDEEPDDE